MNSKKTKLCSTYSTISAKDLLEQVVPVYHIQSPVSCEFWARGINDTYKVVANSGDVALRVYRRLWRKRSEIEFELDALQHLHDRGCDVAFPVQRNDGERITEVLAPEGIRYVIATHFVGSSTLTYENMHDAVEFGQAAAQVHLMSSDFRTECERFALDLDHLLTEPMKFIEPYLSQRKDDWKFLQDLVFKLTERVNSHLSDNMDFGFCHGDFHGFNAHKHNNRIVHFDFDCCGFGPRVYDLATFKWSARLRGKDAEWWPKFLEGYCSVRPFCDHGLELVEPFIGIRHIWLMALHMKNGDDFGKGWMNDHYIDRHIKFMKDVSSNLDSRKPN